MSTHPSNELVLQPLPAGAEPPSLPDGPGWFDSSWALRSGLEVREGWPGEAGLNG